MSTPSAPPLAVDPGLIGELELSGYRVPYVNLEFEAGISSRLTVGETEYVYQRSFPIHGHSAVMPAAVSELLSEGKRVLVAERHERYYVYTA